MNRADALGVISWQKRDSGLRAAHEIWTQPAGPTDATRATNPVLAPLPSTTILSVR